MRDQRLPRRLRLRLEGRHVFEHSRAPGTAGQQSRSLPARAVVDARDDLPRPRLFGPDSPEQTLDDREREACPPVFEGAAGSSPDLVEGDPEHGRLHFRRTLAENLLAGW
jgi:hypothetical protein